MKSVSFRTFGGPEVLEYGDSPTPAISPTEVLVRMRAASLNHLDLWVRSGSREKNIPLPHIPGSDGAGIVAEVGSAVTSVKAGDRVLISPGISCGACPACLSGADNLCPDYRVLGVRENGTCSEFVRIPSVNALPIPDGLDFPQAAAIPLVFLTAWHMLNSLAKLRPNETVLVHGAGSGVGSAAIQIAKALGARVITTAGSDEKLAKARELGADEIINYSSQDFAAEVKRVTSKKGVDVVFEHIGGEVIEKSIMLLAKGGRLVTCGATTSFTANIDLRYVYSRHLTLYGSFMGTKSELIEILKFFSNEYSVWRGTSSFRPVIDCILPLSDARLAHERMESRKHFGKIVLAIG